MKLRLFALFVILAAAGLTGCLRTTVEVKPIQITVDVNVGVDKALDDFFGDLDKKSSTLPSTPAKP